MNPEFAYFLKANAAIALFYAFYRLCFYKDTFFKLRRMILLVFFVVAFVYPLLNIQEWIKEQEPIVGMVNVYAAIILPEISVQAVHPASVNWTTLVHAGISILYIGIIALLLLRFFVRLGSILWLARQSRHMELHGIRVHALPKPAGPFSFFRYIFLYPGSHDEKEIDEILTHERTHVSQWHSVDVVLSELICIGCWFNPFVWLLKREVRHNLEYLADNRVIESGYDSRNYQYHLLGLAHHHPEASGLYNSFNVLHIKNRIRMMNKKRTHGFGRTKYLFVVPLAAALMILNNVGALARMASFLPGKADTAATAPQQSAIQQATVLPSGSPPADSAMQPLPEPVSPPVGDTKAAPAEKTPQAHVSGSEAQSAKPIFTVVESMPRYPGGDAELFRYLNQTVKYPVEAQAQGIEGRVICAFIVSEDGTINDVNVVRSVHESLDKEAIRVVKSMPLWEPGRQRGQTVSVKYTLPIQFRLAGDASSSGTAVASDGTAVGLEQEAEDAHHIYTVVDVMPAYPGGDNELFRFLSKNIRYPADAVRQRLKGRVICTFVVNRDGSISDAEVIRGVDTLLDQEALRVVSSMPNWKPGKKNGQTVRVKYTLPVQFKLE